MYAIHMLRKKVHIKSSWKEKLLIALSWLIAAAMAYLAYLKIKLL